MKILRVISHLNVGGVQRQMLRAFHQLKALGVECHVCCLDEPGTLAPQFQAGGFPVHHIPLKARLDPLGLWKLRRLIFQKKFAVVHGQMYASNMSTNAALLGCKAPVLINGYHNQIYVSSKPQGKKVLASADKPHAFVAVGENVKSALVAGGIPMAKIHVVTNGVDEPTSPVPFPKYDESTPVKLYWAGRFVPQKQPEFFLKVAECCRKISVPVEFTLYGNGVDWDNFQQQVMDKKLQDFVKTPGETTELFQAIEEHEIYCSASYREGFPNALLEGLIAGKPALVHNIEPHTEVLGNTSAGVALPLDAEKWAKQIFHWYKNRNELQHRSNEARLLGQKHTIKNTALATIKLYESLLQKP
ncbi:MAG: glycosyltransferase family 4 protein [Sumerlaeia bacterium]